MGVAKTLINIFRTAGKGLRDQYEPSHKRLCLTVASLGSGGGPIKQRGMREEVLY